MPPRKPTPQEEARARFDYYRTHPEANKSRGGNPGGGSGATTQSRQGPNNMPGPQGTGDDADGFLASVFKRVRNAMGGN